MSQNDNSNEEAAVSELNVVDENNNQQAMNYSSSPEMTENIRNHDEQPVLDRSQYYENQKNKNSAIPDQYLTLLLNHYQTKDCPSSSDSNEYFSLKYEKSLDELFTKYNVLKYLIDRHAKECDGTVKYFQFQATSNRDNKLTTFHQITSRGKPGVCGVNGKSGKDGRFGSNGKTGVIAGYKDLNEREFIDRRRLNGCDGEDGTEGQDGGNGSHGEDASDIYLKVSLVDDHLLKMSGSIEVEINNSMEQVSILVDSRGGDGGRGGNGGHGGNGGNGGSGANNENGRGGDGGNGGKGANSGRGGNGGNSGQGGNVVIESSNSECFILFKALTSCGKPGEAGFNGRPGIGGFGGNAGCGRLDDQRYNGKNGASGADGTSPPVSQNGSSRSSGKHLFIVTDENGNVIEYSDDIFNIAVKDFAVYAMVDDGIFSPGEPCYLSDIVIENNGKLTLPPMKAKLSFPSISSQETLLPRLRPGERATIRDKFNFKISSESVMTISSQVTVLGRKLSNDGCLEKSIPCGLPIVLNNLEYPNTLGRTQSCTCRFDVRNVSISKFGQKKKRSAKVRVSMIDPHLKTRIVRSIATNVEAFRDHFEETLDVDPGDTQDVTFDIVVDDKASFFVDKLWKIELYVLYENETEYCMIHSRSNSIQITPHYIESSSNEFDLLFVMHPSMRKNEFLKYQSIIDGLGLNCNYWDISKQNGFSRVNGTNEKQSTKWLKAFSGKVIMFPLVSESGETISRLSRHKPTTSLSEIENDFILVSQEGDLIRGSIDVDSQRQPSSRHSGETTSQHVDQKQIEEEYKRQQEKLCEELFSFIDTQDIISHISNGDSGFIVVNGPESTAIINHLFSCATQVEIDEKSLSYGLSVFSTPTEDAFLKKCNEFISKLREQHPSKLFRLNTTNFNVQKKGFTKTKLGDASYRSLAPMSCIDRLYILPNFGNLEDEKIHIHKTVTFYTNSKFFSIFFTLLCSLSVQRKLQILTESYSDTIISHAENWTFRYHEDQREEYRLYDLLTSALFYDLIQEFFFKDLGLNRLHEMVKVVSNNLLDFAFQDSIYMLWNIIQRLERAKLWKSSSWSKLQNLVGKRTELMNVKKGMHTLLFEGKMEQNVNHLLEIKQDAENFSDPLRIFLKENIFVQPLLSDELKYCFMEEFKGVEDKPVTMNNK
ncbi:hypothetical protein C9374_009181 [Naegleria lovaniensis]|uniref:DUF7932 domain-containing protein n=1 Tax=Naegleria lovaniensis TaxID=51637 RepID=A0AA88KFC0_NAELO|nr:uncharacterized protein C9374_009181 [Naegleria lovaniensis]KAG2377665.1 hypothetical protein C9374_009181 [Naegleria lovaniensis]